MKRIVSFVLLMAPLWLCAQFSINGTVRAKTTDEPLPGAEIALIELEKVVFANQAGAFRFDNVPAGTYTLQVKAKDYLTYADRIQVSSDLALNFLLIRTISITEEVLITSTRASERTATTYSELDKEEIEEQNYGQDMPFLLNSLPSTVVTSDAGAGIGYTGIRIRGSDPTRTNVTINGIPLNDAESHGVFWVNLPDFASSVNTIQVQRGVGTSTNGAAAFGASINIQTTTLSYTPYAELDNSFGSFNTWRNTLSVGTGLIKDRFSIDARLSNITSDGYIDRAFSDLKSFYVSAGYYGDNSLLKFNVFAGKEQTYQAWWGVPESFLDDEELRRSNYYTYDNETDNYWQDHYQLMYSKDFSSRLNLYLALHYTRGRGYFEQYREDDDFLSYGLPNLEIGDTLITSTDLIRRRWLDNDFYGFVYSLRFVPSERLELTLGGGANRYDGDHFGEIIWARFAGDTEIRDRYYDNRGLKDDYHSYLKGIWQATPYLTAYADLQVRFIDYRLGNMDLNGPGVDNDQQLIEGDYRYTFFNPKVGLTWQVNESSHAYASFSVGNREPVRNDFIDAPEGRVPEPETLYNLEAGYRFRSERLSLNANYYLMDYTNQLVLNGELNDVGANVRQNVPDSYRMGVELEAQWNILNHLQLAGNLALSRNKIRSFEEVIYNYDDGTVVRNTYENTDISFSPNIVGGATLAYQPVENLQLTLLGKYVGSQFLDNTSNPERQIDAFLVNDFRASYRINPVWIREIELGLQVNNLFDVRFEANGYTFSYIFGNELVTENFYYPQAGINFLARLVIRI